MIGRIHSVQSLGAVDGPGLRYVVFMQGCPLRCIYCHNPDTWDALDGQQITPQQLIAEIDRYLPYFGEKGGVTLTGGEPLLQWEFTEDLFARLQAKGIHTALDTCGHASSLAVQRVLAHTDLVLCDCKFVSEEAYRQYTSGSFQQVLHFLQQAADLGVAVWLRHVIVPGITDSEQNLHRLIHVAQQFPNIQKIELLPFRKLCIEKYQTLGIPFPLEATPACSAETINQLTQLLPPTYR